MNALPGAEKSQPTKRKRTRTSPSLRKRVLAVDGRSAAWLLLAVIVVLRWSGPARDSVWSLAAAVPLQEGSFDVVRVIDGDTLVVSLSSGEDRPAAKTTATVRLLGINAPEDTTKKEPLGAEATAYLREAAEGKTVRLEWDKRRIDRYGRRLAYVYADDVLLNEDLVRRGLARMLTYPGDSSTYSRALGKAQDFARRSGLGIWERNADEDRSDASSPPATE